MLQRIKASLLQLRTWRLQQQPATRRSNVGFAHAQRIGILYTDTIPDKHDVVGRFVAALRQKGKDVMGLCYATEQAYSAPLERFATFTQSDIGIWRPIKHLAAQQFVQTPFDYLFHVDLMGHPVLDYILAKSQAQCRVGYLDTQRTHLFEVMVTFQPAAEKHALEALTTQMLHYVQLLNASS